MQSSESYKIYIYTEIDAEKKSYPLQIETPSKNEKGELIFL
jgi:hypothetical protein